MAQFQTKKIKGNLEEFIEAQKQDIILNELKNIKATLDTLIKSLKIGEKK